MIGIASGSVDRQSLPTFQVRYSADIGVPMRDGTRLSLDLYAPDAPGPFPVVLVRTPYDNSDPYYVVQGQFWAQRGYAFAAQDVRGRFDSLGTYYTWHNEATDGFDTQEWIGRQAWCDGSIGTVGSSYDGATQWLSAPLQSRYLKAMIPAVTPSDFWHEDHYVGGAFTHALNSSWAIRNRARSQAPAGVYDWRSLWWSLPIVDVPARAGVEIPAYRDWVDHPAYDDYWRAISLRHRWHEIGVPVLNEAGWFDAYAGAACRAYSGVSQLSTVASARGSQRLVIGPWPHELAASSRTGHVDFGPHSVLDLRTVELRFFDHWLKGIDNGLADEAPVRIFVMGANEWRDEPTWPLDRARETAFYLHSRGEAGRLRSDGTLDTSAPDEEPTDGYTYDPMNPVLTWGGNHSLEQAEITVGPLDQRLVEAREDVLTYSTAVLERAEEVTGAVHIVLYVESSAPDTDFTARLVDVHPDGRAMNVTEGVLRTRYRDSWEEPRLMEAGHVHELTIDMGVTSQLFREGHRIQVDISSSNFPRLDRNLNTGRANGLETEMEVARQVIHHSRHYPSHLVLPVVARA